MDTAKPVPMNYLIRQLVNDGRLKQADVLKFRRILQLYIKGELNMIPKMKRATAYDFEIFETIIIKG